MSGKSVIGRTGSADWPLALPEIADLRADEVHVWVGRVHQYSSILQEWTRRFLPSEEQIRIAKLLRPDDRLRASLARLMARTLLARYTEREPRELLYSPTDQGKPQLAEELISFNWSHSGEYVLLAVAAKGEVGVDVEEMNRSNLNSLAPAVLSERELGRWVGLTGLDQIRFFYHRWTLKEAVLKARGVGLSCDVRGIDPAGLDDLEAPRLENAAIAAGFSYYVRSLYLNEQNMAAVAFSAPSWSLSVFDFGAIARIPD